MVGNSSTTGDAAYHAFLYSGTTMTDLKQVVSELFGWSYACAFDINDAGQIIGWGNTPSGDTHTLLQGK